jgi:2-haloacid dehalogenase
VGLSRTLSQPKGVIFDLGNVLIEWQPHAAVAAGLGADEATRFMTADDFDFMAFNHVLDAGGTWEDGEAELRRTHPHWVGHAAAYRAHFPESLVGEVPGTVAVVRELHAAGVPMFGLTNWPDEFWPHAPRKFEFLGLLDDIVVSGTEGVAKPDPEIFEIAVTRAGIPASQLVFVDDKQVNVSGAIDHGLDGILFTGAEALRAALRERGLPV